MAGKVGLDMLLSEYKHSPNLKKYITCFLEEFAEVKQALADIVKYRYLADSFGVMVDDIAYLVGASRIIYGADPLGYFGFYSEPSALPAGDDNKPGVGGILKSDNDRDSGDFVRTDLQLKNAIRARILKITGNCNVEQMIAYIELVVGRELRVEIMEHNDKTFDVIVHEALPIGDKVLLAYMLPEFKPAGIRMSFRDDGGDISLPYVSNVYPPER